MTPTRRGKDVLSNIIVESIFIALEDGLLDTSIGPERPNRFKIIRR